jgi:hypothetical protein
MKLLAPWKTLILKAALHVSRLVSHYLMLSVIAELHIRNVEM